MAGRSGAIHTSADGRHWDHHPGVGENIELRRIRHQGGQFVAFGLEYLPDGRIGGVVYSSSDGRSWTLRLQRTPSNGYTDVYFEGIAFGNDRFAVVGSQFDALDNLAAEPIVYTSADGVEWTRAASDPLLANPAGLAFGAAGFVLLDAGRILTSPDGVAWQLRHALDPSDGFWVWRGIAAAGNRIVCYAEQPSDPTPRERTVVSENGLSWQETPLLRSPGDEPKSLFSDDAVFFALGERSILTSADGLAWSERFTSHPLDLQIARLNDVSFGPHGFLSVGDEGTIIASADGTVWEKRVSGTPFYLSDVIHGGGLMVATGAAGTLLHSDDGRTWTPGALRLEGVPVSLSLGPLTHGAGRFILLSDLTASLLASGFPPSSALSQLDLRHGPAGTTWNLQRSPTLSDWQTLHPITLQTDTMELNLTPLPEGKGFWRLAPP